MKIIAMTVGTMGGVLVAPVLLVDYGLNGVAFLVVFFILVISQLVAPKYIPFLYWITIVASGAASIAMTNYMGMNFGPVFTSSSPLIFTALLSIVIVSPFVERSLAVENVRSTQLQSVYWAVILVSNIFGTAIGNFFIADPELGTEGSFLLISAILLVAVISYYYTRISKVTLFWTAFTFTGPFGLIIGDLLSNLLVARELHLGARTAFALLSALLILLVFYDTIVSERRQKHFTSLKAI